MTFNDLAAVSGKPGLYKVIKPTRSGLILESLDEKKSKLITGPHHRVSLLAEISIYTTDIDKTIPLEDIFRKIKEEFGEDPGLDAKAEKDELFAFLKEIVPDYDPDRVYASDIKKIVSWYSIIYKGIPEILEQKKEEEKKDEKKGPKSETKGTGKKPTAKNVPGKGATSPPKAAPVKKSTTQRKSGG